MADISINFSSAGFQPILPLARLAREYRGAVTTCSACRAAVRELDQAAHREWHEDHAKEHPAPSG